MEQQLSLQLQTSDQGFRAAISAGSPEKNGMATLYPHIRNICKVSGVTSIRVPLSTEWGA